MPERPPIGVIGVGWVGLVTAACFAELGHPVYCRDIDERKVRALAAGEVTIHEAGLPELVARNAERLHFSTELADMLEHARLLFVCVDTPPTYSGDADLSRVRAVVEALEGARDHAIVMKSTVPVGTGAKLRRDIAAAGGGLAYVSNPEFLQEGSAVADFMDPDRVVIGADADAGDAPDAVAALYEPLGAEIVRTDVASAEMIKLASNAFLATKISFINEIANVSEEVGADVAEVARGMGLDDRIGPKFLSAGIGFGGSCLAGGETVLARESGCTRLTRLDELFAGLDDAPDRDDPELSVAHPEGLEVLSWREGCDAPEFLPVAAATRRPYGDEAIEIRTKMGRRVVTTADHPFAVGDGVGGAAQVKAAATLSNRDWLPVAQGAPVAGVAEELELGMLAGVAAAGLTEREVIARPAPREIEAIAEQRIPDLAWSLPVDLKWELLSGLWEGDGSWSYSAHGPSVALQYGTVSRELADGILRLLGDLGIVARLRIGRTPKSTQDTYWLTVSGAEQVERSLRLVPASERAEVLAALARQDKRIAPTDYRRDGDGTAWVRVTSVERRPFTGAVYSLEVPGAHTFVTSAGLVVHNCFPKDVSALKQLAGNSGYHFQLLNAVIEVNELQKRRVIGKLKKHLGSLVGKRIALLGLAFKPNTDDMREASSLVLAARLQGEGAQVVAYDPVAEQAARELLHGAELAPSARDALKGADAAVLVTEWPEFRELDWTAAGAAMRRPLVIDGRNFLDRETLGSAGFTYEGVGR